MELNFSEQTKGMIYLIGGLVTLVYTFGWFQIELHTLMLAGASLMAIYGFVKSGLLTYLQSLMSSNKKE